MWPIGSIPDPVAPLESPLNQLIESKLNQLQGDFAEKFYVKSIAGLKWCFGFNFTNSSSSANYYMDITTTGCSPAVPDFSFDVWGNFTGSYSNTPPRGGGVDPCWNPTLITVTTSPLVQVNPWGFVNDSETHRHDGGGSGAVQTLSSIRPYITDFNYAVSRANDTDANVDIASTPWYDVFGGTPGWAGWDCYYAEYDLLSPSPPADLSMPAVGYAGGLQSINPGTYVRPLGKSMWAANQTMSTVGGSAAPMQAYRTQFMFSYPEIFWFGKVIGIGQFDGSGDFAPTTQFGADPYILTRIANPFTPLAPPTQSYVAMAIPGTTYEIPFPSDTPWIGGYDSSDGQCVCIYLFYGITPAEWAAANPTWTVV